MPHIFLEQVLKDVNNWNKEKEEAYNLRNAEKIKLSERARQAKEEKRLKREAKLKEYE